MYMFIEQTLKYGEAVTHAFDRFMPLQMPLGRREAYQQAVGSENAVDEFSAKLWWANDWANSHPDQVDRFITEFDVAVGALNSEQPGLISPELYPNSCRYLEEAKIGARLPQISELTNPTIADRHKFGNLKAAVTMARKLQAGATIRPAEGDYYGFPKFINTPAGMAAALLVDGYEDYVRQLGLYPESAEPGALVANALAEMLHKHKSDGELFKVLQRPVDGWIYGYDEFSPYLQQLLYGNDPEPVGLGSVPFFERLQPLSQEIESGAYNILLGGQEVGEFNGDNFRPTLTKADRERASLIPGLTFWGDYFISSDKSHPVVSFNYYKLDKFGDLETNHRLIVWTGTGYGVHPEHAGQNPSWYIVGPQLGTVYPNYGDTSGVDAGSSALASAAEGNGRSTKIKNFSLDCIVGNPNTKYPVLANPI